MDALSRNASSIRWYARTLSTPAENVVKYVMRHGTHVLNIFAVNTTPERDTSIIAKEASTIYSVIGDTITWAVYDTWYYYLMSEADIRAERIKKLKILKAVGMAAYPATSGCTIWNADFITQFDALVGGRTEETIAGRVMSLRGQGGIMFADVFDGTGRLQVVLQKEELDKEVFVLFRDTVDSGDFIQCSGVAYQTKRGEKSILAKSWIMLAKAILPIPSEWFGLKDEEKILRERYLDILMNPDVRVMFERRSKFWQAIRGFYLSRGFLEVETPVLENSPGGAEARPFKTHHNALGIDVYLRISAGELWQKRLLVAGFPKVFEIGRIFRNEGQSREHVQDYSQLESYEAYADVQSGMTFVQELYRHVAKEVYGQYTFTIGAYTIDFAEEWPILDFCELVEKRYGVHPIESSEKELCDSAKKEGGVSEQVSNRVRALDYLWKQIRKTIAGPAFLVGVPVELEPLAKRSAKNERVVERVQILIAGSEVGKGFSELNDPIDQRARFEAQQALRDAGDDEAQRLDEEYIRAMEYGMPPAFGFGVSERLFAFLENKPIHETQLFPLLRPKI